MTKPATLPEPQVTANPKFETRRHKRRTEEDKRRIIAEADACTERGELSALCRRENIQSSQISTWRQRFAENGEKALVDRTPGRKPAMTPEARELERVKQENERLRQQLGVKDDLLELQKKAFAIVDRLNGENKP
jgi:transposase-like protein